MTIVLEHKRFFDKLVNSPEVTDLLIYAHKNKLSVGIVFTEFEIKLFTDSNTASNKYIRIIGCFRSKSLINFNFINVSSFLLLPYIFLIEEIYFPSSAFFTFGRDTRTVADLFVRNLFYWICRSEKIDLEVLNKNLNVSLSRVNRELSRAYSFILKAYLNEKIFERSNLSELILVSVHMPILEFTNPIIANVVKNFQNRLNSKNDFLKKKEIILNQKQVFMRARMNMLDTH